MIFHKSTIAKKRGENHLSLLAGTYGVLVVYIPVLTNVRAIYY